MNSAFPVADFNRSSSLMDAQRLMGAVRTAKSETGFRLSDASLRYVATLYDPRSVYEDAWVPYQTQFSEPGRLFCRGTFATGTTGFGFCALCPALTNNATIMKRTAANSVGGSGTTLNSFTNLDSTGTLNSKYANADMASGANQVSGRYVGIVLYVRYAGTELNRGGDYVLFEEPNHQDVGANYSYTSMLAQDGAKRIPITNDWVKICFTPNSYAELNFATNSGRGPLSPVTADSILCVAVNSAGATQPFEFEVYERTEYVGAPCRAAHATFEDLLGFGVVVSACSMFQQLDEVLGLDGFMAAIHAQMRNQSGILMSGAPHGNWAGLLPMLPHLAALVGPGLLSLGKTAIKAFAGKKNVTEAVGKKLEKKAGKAVAKAEKKKKKKKGK